MVQALGVVEGLVGEFVDALDAFVLAGGVFVLDGVEACFELLGFVVEGAQVGGFDLVCAGELAHEQLAVGDVVDPSACFCGEVSEGVDEGLVFGFVVGRFPDGGCVFVEEGPVGVVHGVGDAGGAWVATAGTVGGKLVRAGHARA